MLTTDDSSVLGSYHGCGIGWLGVVLPGLAWCSTGNRMCGVWYWSGDLDPDQDERRVCGRRTAVRRLAPIPRHMAVRMSSSSHRFAYGYRRAAENGDLQQSRRYRGMIGVGRGAGLGRSEVGVGGRANIDL